MKLILVKENLKTRSRRQSNEILPSRFSINIATANGNGCEPSGGDSTGLLCASRRNEKTRGDCEKRVAEQRTTEDGERERNREAR